MLGLDYTEADIFETAHIYVRLGLSTTPIRELGTLKPDKSETA